MLLVKSSEFFCPGVNLFRFDALPIDILLIVAKLDILVFVSSKTILVS